jgi:hypothetical protein
MPKGLRGFMLPVNDTSSPVVVIVTKQFLGAACRRDLLSKTLNEVRQQYDFFVWG